MKDENKLVIREFPTTTLGFGLGFMFFGWVIYTVSPKSNWIPALIMGGIGLVAVAFFSQMLIITADKRTRILRLRYRGLLWGSVKNIPFDTIQALQIASSTTTGKAAGNSTGVSVSYCIEVVLKNGKTVPFRAYYSKDFLAQQYQVRQVCDFTGLPQIGETKVA